MNPKEYLEREAKQINESLSEIQFDDKNIKDMFGYAVSSGRRLRGVLLLTCCNAVGGESKNALPAALAVELIHKSSLIHDDIIDESEMRRGKKTFHRVYGSDKGVIMGDLVCATAFESIKQLEKDFDEGTIIECYDLLADSLDAIYRGQYADLAFEGSLACTESDFIDMLVLKSGRLIENSARMGALLGGGKEEEIKALASYAKNLAIAFQIQNDINNIMGNERKLGIRRATDLFQKKCSVSIIHALNIGDNKEKIGTLLRADRPTKKDVSELVKILKGGGSIEYAQSCVVQRLEKTRKSLKPLRESQTKEFLLNLAVFDTHKWYW